MDTISQRELRNDNADVIRRVEDGESLTVTRHGVPVARLVPYAGDDLKCDRPAKARGGFDTLKRVQSDESVASIIDDLRGDR